LQFVLFSQYLDAVVVGEMVQFCHLLLLPISIWHYAATTTTARTRARKSDNSTQQNKNIIMNSS
jgi:hypothetical protein